MSGLFRLLGDEGRLRLLRVLSRERLNVTELTGVLGLAQSGVSRHLGLLKDAGLVEEQKEGGFSYYRAASALARNGNNPLREMLERQFAASTGDPALRADDARLHEVLRLRTENFEAHAGPDTRDSRQLVPGRSWAAWSRALGMLLPPLRVADVGCGEGYLTLEAARWAARVVAIDRSAAVLRRARALAARRRVKNIVWKQGELEKLPIADGQMDLVLLSQALHHAREPRRAAAEAARVLASGGRLLVLDLKAHNETWVRSKLGDQVLGFAEAELAQLLAGAGFDDVRVGTGAQKKGDPFAVVLACGVKRR
jgi:ArsR family transcriptional regulator